MNILKKATTTDYSTPKKPHKRAVRRKLTGVPGKMIMTHSLRGSVAKAT